MLKLLLDTNVILDVMVESRPNHAASRDLIGACMNRAASVKVSAGSLKDAYYIISKHYSEPAARASVEWALEYLRVAPVDYAICHEAIQSDEPDFEDGIVRAVAEAEDVDYIVTHDKDAFLRSSIKAIPAWMALELL